MHFFYLCKLIFDKERITKKRYRSFYPSQNDELDKSNSRLQLPFHTSYLSYDVFSLDSCSFLQFFRYLSLLSLLESFYDPNLTPRLNTDTALLQKLGWEGRERGKGGKGAVVRREITHSYPIP